MKNVDTNSGAPEAKDKAFLVEGIELDKIEFKAITDGLGFHQNREAGVGPRNLPLKSSIKRTERTQWQNPGKGELAAFYNPTANTASAKVQAPIAPVILPEAKMEIRFAAWLMDFGIILCSFMALLTVLFFFSGLSLSQLESALKLNEFLVYLPLVFSFFYILYFTILDATNKGSFGKSFFGLKLVLEDGNKTPNISVALLRSLVTLSSIIFLGLPTLLDFQDHLGNSKVVAQKRT